jgi:hypothetical protein
VREIARAQVRAWQRQRFGGAYLVGGEHASYVDLGHRVGAALGKRTPRNPVPAWALMTYASRPVRGGLAQPDHGCYALKERLAAWHDWTVTGAVGKAT